MSFFKAAKSLVSNAVKFTARAALGVAFVGATLAVGTAGLFVGALAAAVVVGALSAISGPFALAIAVGLVLAFRSGMNEAKKEESKAPPQKNYAPPSQEAKIAALQSRSLANDWKAAQQTQQWQPTQSAAQQQLFNQDPNSNSGQAPYSASNYYAWDYRY